jgi:ubiquinone biosynthesis accessory factor UbiJ
MLTEALENALNRGLPRSPRAGELCAELAGRRVGIEVRSTPWHLVVSSDGRSLQLQRAASLPGVVPDASLSGSPLALLALATSAPQTVIQRGAVTITGDAELVQRFSELVRLLRPDIEEELSRVLGDTPAHYAARIAQGALNWGRHAARTAVNNVAEYLAHERGELVPRAEGEQYLRGVERLREDVERLEARVARLAPPGPGAAGDAAARAPRDS